MKSCFFSDFLHLSVAIRALLWYPKLIDEDQLIAANEKRSNKPQLPKKTEAQKVLRRLCGTPPSERVEQSVTGLLNGLANYPERIQHQRSPTPATHSKTHYGEFVDGGFIYNDTDTSLLDILYQDEPMTMGGM